MLERFREGCHQPAACSVFLAYTAERIADECTQVRNPSGELNFGMATDRDGEPIPPGPDGAGGTPPAHYTLSSFLISSH